MQKRKKVLPGSACTQKADNQKQKPSQISACKKVLHSFASLWQDCGQRKGCFGKISDGFRHANGGVKSTYGFGV